MSTATETGVTIPPGKKNLEWIFLEHYGFVHRTAHRVTGNAADAEDVLQTLFLRLYRREFPPELSRNPKAYLYRAAVNIALDIVRARQRHDLTGGESELREIPAPGALSRGEEELNERLRVAVASLKPKAAEIFLLRYVHGYTIAEVADLLGISAGAVAIGLFRTRGQLRKAIRRYSREAI
jgi:RNA polymerase sigma-70 factor (ECF subfamily)